MASELEVGKVNISSADGVLQMGSTAANGSPSLKLCEQVSSGDISNGFSFNVDGDGTNNLHIKRHVVSASGTDVMVLDRDSGNVGINCAAPTVGQLQIDHASGSTLALTRTAGATTGTLGLVRFGNRSIDSNLANILVYQDNANDAAAIAFQTQPTGGSTVTRLTIDSTGLATFSKGIKTEKGILSGTVLIDDDAVTTITPPRKGGFMKLIVDSATAEAGEYPQAAFSGEVFFDCGTSLQVNKSTGISAISGDLNTSTSDVSGTTGTDGKVTIAVQAGVIKIENRSNGQKRFNYLLYC